MSFKTFIFIYGNLSDMLGFLENCLTLWWTCSWIYFQISCRFAFLLLIFESWSFLLNVLIYFYWKWNMNIFRGAPLVLQENSPSRGLWLNKQQKQQLTQKKPHPTKKRNFTWTQIIVAVSLFGVRCNLSDNITTFLSNLT